MIDKENSKPLRIFGIVTVLFWLSHLLFLPPIKNSIPEMRRERLETREMRQVIPDMYKSEENLEAEHARSVRAVIIMLVIIAVGVLSGILLRAMRLAGWIMAFVLCSGFLLLHVADRARYYPDVWGRMQVIFTLLLPLHPVRVIYYEVVTPLFFIVTIMFLTRKPVLRFFVARSKPR
jgi:hypothetical protein